jgi:hypothetical protein
VHIEKSMNSEAASHVVGLCSQLKRQSVKQRPVES